jgi:hypothetical protein
MVAQKRYNFRNFPKGNENDFQVLTREGMRRHVTRRNDSSSQGQKKASKHRGLYLAKNRQKLRENQDSKFTNQMKRTFDQKRRSKSVLQNQNPKVTSHKLRKERNAPQISLQKMANRKRIKDKKFEDILKASVMEFRHKLRKHHENILKNKKLIFKNELDVKQKKFTLQNLKKIYEQVRLSVHMTKQVVNNEYCKLLTI